jgi:2-phosphosulfolactate phosphatase
VLNAFYRQAKYGVRSDWGLTGARMLADDSAALVVVDVLSFTTSVSIAVSRRWAVLPYQWGRESAPSHASIHAATLAVGRHQVNESQPWSLSPASLMSAPDPMNKRLVLPSPNGSTISFEGQGSCERVLVSSLRNARSVASALGSAGYGTLDKPIVVIASGEQWPDNTIRPGLEDALGAGYLISLLISAGADASPEAIALSKAWRTTKDVSRTVHECASGQELIDDGYESDVAVAAQVDVDTSVPVLVAAKFRHTDKLEEIASRS